MLAGWWTVDISKHALLQNRDVSVKDTPSVLSVEKPPLTKDLPWSSSEASSRTKGSEASQAGSVPPSSLLDSFWTMPAP